MRFLFLLLLPLTVFADKGTIILLNGPSSVGKSTLQQAIQEGFPQFYLKVGIDNFFDALIPKPEMTNFEKTKEYAQYTPDGILIRKLEEKEDPSTGKKIVSLVVGPAGDKIMQGMHNSLASYASRGNNLVVDYILYKPEWIQDLVENLRNYRVYVVGVNAPLTKIEEREKNRAETRVGYARGHYKTVHQNMVYDLEFDTSKMTPKQIALQIKIFMAENPEPKAFRQMITNQETISAQDSFKNSPFPGFLSK